MPMFTNDLPRRIWRYRIQGQGDQNFQVIIEVSADDEWMKPVNSALVSQAAKTAFRTLYNGIVGYRNPAKYTVTSSTEDI